MIIRANQDQTLAHITADYYGDLDMLDAVLAENEHLSKKVFLAQGDMVNLPDRASHTQQTTTTSTTLW